MRKKVSPKELSLLTEYIASVSGIVLDQSKSYLVESRLGPLLEEMEFADYAELHRKAILDTSGKLCIRIIDAISTNETSFFRDSHPFELLAHKILPDYFEQANGQPLRIWSAASSTGQEVYSIAMVLKELLFDLSKYKIRIIGSDISTEVLKTASTGRFNKLELSRGLSADRLRKHFTREGSQWRINDDLRTLVLFDRVNIMDPLTRLGHFHIIFCRNVAIYFSKENRIKLLDRLADRLLPEGKLIIGSTESLVGITSRFKRCEFRGKIYYEKV